MTTFSPTPHQQKAITSIEQWLKDPSRQVFNLQGHAGTGKTTVASEIARRYPSRLCAYTMKAASVLAKKSGLETSTIHGLFYQFKGRETDEETGETDLLFDKIHVEGALEGKLVIVDESSMISIDMAKDLMHSGAKILSVGDPGQLPPVNGIRAFLTPDYLLTEIHRQAAESAIIRQATRVRITGNYHADGDDFRIVEELSDDDLMTSDVIICWTNRTRDLMNRRMRALLGYTSPLPTVGEKVLCLKNAKDYGVSNGSVYTLKSPILKKGLHTIRVDLGRYTVGIPDAQFARSTNQADEHATSVFDSGYALTCHKAQGSEYDKVALIDEHPEGGDDRIQWVYTGISRAARSIVIHKPKTWMSFEDLMS